MLDASPAKIGLSGIRREFQFGVSNKKEPYSSPCTAREGEHFYRGGNAKNEDHGIPPHHFMANRYVNNGVTDFIFLGSIITVDGDCSHEIKRRLLLGRKVMTNLDSILKSRDITLSTRVCLVKAMVFPVVMYGCESWTIKKAEHQRIDAFELCCWRRLLRVL